MEVNYKVNGFVKKKAFIRRKSIYRTNTMHTSKERKSTYEKQRTVGTTPDHKLLMTSSRLILPVALV